MHALWCFCLLLAACAVVCTASLSVDLEEALSESDSQRESDRVFEMRAKPSLKHEGDLSLAYADFLESLAEWGLFRRRKANRGGGQSQMDKSKDQQKKLKQCAKSLQGCAMWACRVQSSDQAYKGQCPKANQIQKGVETPQCPKLEKDLGSLKMKWCEGCVQQVPKDAKEKEKFCAKAAGVQLQLAGEH